MTAVVPTEAGFLTFVREAMGISTAALPDNSDFIPLAYALSIETVNPFIQQVSCLLYQQAVYNLAGSNLLNIAPDQTGSTYFADARKAYGMNSFVAGVISETHDGDTGQGMLVADAFKGLTIANLQQLKDPYGRAYLAIAQSFAPLWGVS